MCGLGRIWHLKLVSGSVAARLASVLGMVLISKAKLQHQVKNQLTKTILLYSALLLSSWTFASLFIVLLFDLICVL